MKKVENNKEIHQELIELSPTVAKMLRSKKPDDLPFKYFEKLPDKVLHSLATTQQHKSLWWEQILLVLNAHKRKVMVFAAALSLILLTVISLYQSADREFNLADIQPLDIQSYLLNHADDLDDEQLSMLPMNMNTGKDEIMHVSDEELQPILDEYLYQVHDIELN